MVPNNILAMIRKHSAPLVGRMKKMSVLRVPYNLRLFSTVEAVVKELSIMGILASARAVVTATACTPMMGMSLPVPMAYLEMAKCSEQPISCALI